MSADISPLAEPLPLPCGVVLDNRLAKGAMTEGLADEYNRSTPELETLYRRWADSGCGMLLTGNIQVDRRYMERPGNVAVDGNGGEAELRAYAEAGSNARCALWAQVGHAGRQVSAITWPQPVGPSAVGMGAALEANYPPPRELSEAEILDVIERFATACATLKAAGFGGVQVHAAHGYLVSSFLSPLANRRADRWGGSLENRARLLREVIAAVRASVGAAYPVAIKLNSSDFQQGGFTPQECCQVVEWLGDLGVDLLEISGGSYMQPAMVGALPESTQRREAYFLQYARQVRAVAKMPLMVTGGFRTRAAMEAALTDDGIDAIGLARPLIVQPDVARGLLDGSVERVDECEQPVLWHYEQIRRMARGLDPDPQLDAKEASRATMARDAAQAAALLGRVEHD